MASNLASILQTLKSNVAQLPSTYQRPEYTNVSAPQVMSFADLQNRLGSSMQYDANSIKKLYQDATNSAYESSQKSQTAAERSFWQSLSNLQNTSMDALKGTESSAIASGTNKGMSAANQLSAILGLQEEGLTQSTDLVANRQLMASEYASQLSQDAKDALGTSNDFQSQLATLMRQLYADQQTQQASELAYNQSINSDSAGYAASYDTAYASLMDALAQASSDIYGYDGAYGTNAGSGGGYSSGGGGGYTGAPTGGGATISSLMGDSSLGSTLARSQQGIGAQTQASKVQPQPTWNQPRLREYPLDFQQPAPSLGQLASTIPTGTAPLTEEEEKRRRRNTNGAQARPRPASSVIPQGAVNSLVNGNRSTPTPINLPSNLTARGATGSATMGYLSNQQVIAQQQLEALRAAAANSMSLETTSLDRTQQGVTSQTSSARQGSSNSSAASAAMQAAAVAAARSRSSVASGAVKGASSVVKPSSSVASGATKGAAPIKKKSSTAASHAARGY